MTRPGHESLLRNRGDGVSSTLVSVRRRMRTGESFLAFCVFPRSWLEAHPLRRLTACPPLLPSSPGSGLLHLPLPSCWWLGWYLSSVCPAGQSQADPVSQGPHESSRGRLGNAGAAGGSVSNVHSLKPLSAPGLTIYLSFTSSALPCAHPCRSTNFLPLCYPGHGTGAGVAVLPGCPVSPMHGCLSHLQLHLHLQTTSWEAP